MPEYSLAGITLGAGNWADWFSGTFAALAVTIAVTEGLRNRRKERKMAKAQDAQNRRQVGWKLLGLLNETTTIYNHFWQESDKDRVGFGGEVEIWRSTNPLIGHTSDQSLELTESNLNYLMESKAFDVLHGFQLAYGRYRSIGVSLEEYKVRYLALTEMTPPPNEMQGQVATHNLTEEKALRLMPFTAQVESIVRSLRELLADNMRECLDLLDSYQGHFERLTGSKPLELQDSSRLPNRESIGKEIPRA